MLRLDVSDDTGKAIVYLKEEGRKAYGYIKQVAALAGGEEEAFKGLALPQVEAKDAISQLRESLVGAGAYVFGRGSLNKWQGKTGRWNEERRIYLGWEGVLIPSQ